MVLMSGVKPMYHKQNQSAEGKEIYLMAYTNCHFKKPNDGPARQLNSIYNEFQFEQQIKEPIDRSHSN